MREEEQRAKWRAWGISVLIHAVLFLLVAEMGFFLLIRPSEEQVPADTVWVEQQAGPAGGGGATKAAPSAVSESMQVTMPPAEDLPEITEDYTRHPEKKKDYRKQHRIAEDGAQSDSKAEGNASANSTSPSGSAGGGNSSGKGAGDGSGAGNGNGNGGAGSGSGESNAEPEPARCISKASPEYPSSLRSQNAEGVVALLIYVQDGSVTNVVVTSSSGYGAMDQAAVDAGYRCRFRGSGVYPIRYRFQMTDGDDW